MSGNPVEDNEFGLSSGDEADILALASAVDDGHGTKRKYNNGDDDNLPPPAKRLATTFPSATKALTRDFGLEAFRLKQEQVVARILQGGSAAVVFPTGGGKSLCYQVPALVFSEEDELAGIRGKGEHGITLVVSPLIALMKDQVDALLRRGIKAATLDSTKTREEFLHTCDMMRSGELKILYCAPERLNNEGFVEQMKHVRGGIRLLAVDEAHCISEWGHAFRPDYLKISRFVKEIKAERVICLTATATPRVAKDICKAFDIPENEGLFRTSTYRPNLHLIAESSPTKSDIYPKLIQFLKKNKGATIIYVTLQKHTEELATKLNQEGFKAKAFHAGMETPKKTQLQEDFMRREDLIIVATIAFGMGIDKANIRNVVHMNIPSSLESYSQEIGRAGRDGKKSNCLFYLCGEDLHLRELFARGDLPSLNSTRNLLKDIFNSSGSENVPHSKLPVGAEIKFSHYSQERDFDIRSTTLKNIYAQLELTHGLIRASTPMYTKYNFTAGPSYNTRVNSDKSDAGNAIKKYAKKAAKLHHIDVDLAAATLNVPRPDIVRKLNDWSAEGVLELKPAGVLNVYKITSPLPKSSAKINQIADNLYRSMENREKESLHRIDEMLALITGKQCFTLALASHFGDSLPENKTECGHCQWCLTHEAVPEPIIPKVEFNKMAFNNVLATVAPRDDPRLLARIAFGIHSPRVTALKLGRHPVFGSMEDHEFMHLLKSFTTICEKDQKS